MTRLARPPLRRGPDPLGLASALPGGMLLAVALAMTLLAALALGGAAGAGALAQRWRQGAAAAVTVQLPDADPARQQRALAALGELPDLAEARPMDQQRIATLLRPWLGEVPAMPLPPILELRFAPLPEDAEALAARIQEAVPGAQVETQGVWVARLVQLAERLRWLALGATLLVGLLAMAVVTVAIRAGLAARRNTILVLHELGATDAAIANRYARRGGLLALAGALGGLALALPLLLLLAVLAAPLLGQSPVPAEAAPSLALLPGLLPWPPLLALPLAMAGLAWLAAQLTVRRWLRQLP